MTTQSTRRQFIRSTAAAGFAASVARAASTRKKTVSPHEKITLGFIGVRGMGMANMNVCKKQPDVNIAYIADVDKNVLEKGLANAGGKARGFHDSEKCSSRKTWMAWSSPPPTTGTRSRPSTPSSPKKTSTARSLSPTPSRKAGEWSKPPRKPNASPRWGTRSTPPKTTIASPKSCSQAFSENYPHPHLDGPKHLPGRTWKQTRWDTSKNLDYDFWLGPAPKRPYNPLRSHFNWRYFWDYAGGHYMDFFCHLTDLVHWGMKVGAPLAVAAAGSKYALQDITETPDTFCAVYDYPGFTLNWTFTDANANPTMGRGAGVMFHGANATLHCHYSDFKIIPEGKDKNRKIQLPEPTLQRSPGQERQWLDGIKSRKPCECEFEYGHRLTSAGHLATIAFHTGQKLHWDPANETFKNSPKANQMLTREYRKPYTLPEV